MKALTTFAVLVCVAVAVFTVCSWPDKSEELSRISTPTSAAGRGYVLVRPGFPPAVRLDEYVMRSPVYQVTLPGVYSTGREIIVKGVLPDQKETTLAIEEDWNGMISYAQCLILLEHLKPAYGFEHVHFTDTAVATLQAGESIDVRSFYSMLKQRCVPPLSPQIVRSIKEQLADNGWTPLMLAIFDDDEGAVKMLLEEGLDIEAKNKDNFTATMIAAQAGLHDIVLRLVENGANINAEGQHVSTPLLVASQCGYVRVVELLLRNGANRKAAAADGSSALHYAASWGHLEVVKALVTAGAPLDAVTNKGCTPLMLASENGRAKIVRYLLSHGAAVDIAADDGSTALTKARSGEIKKVLHAATARER